MNIYIQKSKQNNGKLSPTTYQKEHSHNQVSFIPGVQQTKKGNTAQ
jgi:hypothetical protein